MAIVFVISIGFHIYIRRSADFFYIDRKIETHASWKFNEERYKLLEDGFKVEEGNFLYYTEEIFEGGYYIHRLRIIGIPIKYRKVDFARNYCWGFPGMPIVDWFRKWPSKGRKRFKECLPKVELYRKRLN